MAKLSPEEKMRVIKEVLHVDPEAWERGREMREFRRRNPWWRPEPMHPFDYKMPSSGDFSFLIDDEKK